MGDAMRAGAVQHEARVPEIRQDRTPVKLKDA